MLKTIHIWRGKGRNTACVRLVLPGIFIKESSEDSKSRREEKKEGGRLDTGLWTNLTSKVGYTIRVETRTHDTAESFGKGEDSTREEPEKNKGGTRGD